MIRSTCAISGGLRKGMFSQCIKGRKKVDVKNTNCMVTNVGLVTIAGNWNLKLDIHFDICLDIHLHIGHSFWILDTRLDHCAFEYRSHDHNLCIDIAKTKAKNIRSTDVINFYLKPLH